MKGLLLLLVFTLTRNLSIVVALCVNPPELEMIPPREWVNNRGPSDEHSLTSNSSPKSFHAWEGIEPVALLAPTM